MDEFAQRDFSGFDFEVARVFHIAAEAHEARAGVVGRAEFGEGFRAHLDDVFHIAKRLHVVDDRRAHIQPERGGEVGRLDARVGALAFEAFDEAGFFAANVGARAAVHVDFEVVPAAENVFTEVAFGACFGEGGVENFCTFGEFAANINVSKIHVIRPTGNDHSLDELMRIFVNDLAILERARLGFVRIANQINRLGIRMAHEAPFESAGKSRAAAPAQSGIQHTFAELRLRRGVARGRDGQRLAQCGITALALVALEVIRVAFRVDVFQQ